MSIENTLERIANALEALTAIKAHPLQGVQAHQAAQAESVSSAVDAAAVGIAAGAKASVSSRRGRPAKDPAPVAENPAVTKDELMELVRAFVAQKGSQTRAKEILAEYGAGRVAELDAKHYAEVSEKLKAEMK